MNINPHISKLVAKNEIINDIKPKYEKSVGFNLSNESNNKITE